MQAAIRGHLVRCHAVGTLRCVQAIVKMQALIRARHANRLVEGSDDFEKQKNYRAQDIHSQTVVVTKFNQLVSIQNSAPTTILQLHSLLTFIIVQSFPNIKCEAFFLSIEIYSLQFSTIFIAQSI